MSDWLKKNKNKIIIALITVTVLTTAYFAGGVPQNNIPVTNSETEKSIVSEISSLGSETENSTVISAEESEKSNTKEKKESSKASQESQSKTSLQSSENSKIISSQINVSSESGSSKSENLTSETAKPSEENSEISPVRTEDFQVYSEVQSSTVSQINIQQSSQQSERKESSVQSSSPIVQESKPKDTSSKPIEPLEKSETEIVSVPDSANVCTISISCAVLLNHMNELSEEKRSLIPSDGNILKDAKVEFKEGESIFDVLKRVCAENRIHLEFSMVPFSGGAYIEGINNIYEMDCGNVSGWMFSINGTFGTRSCSDYKLSAGDEISWQYSCDLGKDIGNYYYGEDFYASN